MSEISYCEMTRKSWIIFRRLVGFLSIFFVIFCFTKYKEVLDEKKFALPAPSSNIKLNEADLTFGRQQLESMLHDRPEMKQCVSPDDLVYNWAVRQFAGESAGRRIYWDNRAPTLSLSTLSYTVVPRDGTPVYIQIRDKYEAGPLRGFHLSYDVLWWCLIFEISNCSSTDMVNSLYRDALAGSLTRQNWVIGMARTEFKSHLKCREFYSSAWEPFLASKGMSSSPGLWGMRSPTNFEEWLSKQHEKNGYPESVFGPDYDANIAPYVRK